MLLLHPIDNWLFTSRTSQRVVFSCSLSFWAAAYVQFSRYIRGYRRAFIRCTVLTAFVAPASIAHVFRPLAFSASGFFRSDLVRLMRSLLRPWLQYSIVNHYLQELFSDSLFILRFAQFTVSVLVHYHNDTFMRFVKIFSAFILWRFPCVLSAFILRCDFILPCLISFNMACFRRHVLNVGRITIL